MKIQELKLKWTNRSILIFEHIANKTFSLSSTYDILLFYYCVIISNNKDIQLTFDEFIDMTDEDDEYLSYLYDWLKKDILMRQHLYNTKKTTQPTPN